MVSSGKVQCGSGSDAVSKRRQVSFNSPPQRQRARLRKQRLMAKVSDSGFQDDLVSFPARGKVSLLAGSDEPEPAAGQLSTWYLQYGDVGFRIQKEKEAQFHLCNSLSQQPQVGYTQY